MKYEQNKDKDNFKDLNFKKNISMLNTNLTEKIQNKDISDKNPNSYKYINNQEIKNNLFFDTNDKKELLQQKQNKIKNKQKKEKDYKDEINNNNPLNRVEYTKKIDYRYYNYYPLDNIVPFSEYEKNEDYFWLATYDKLIKKKKIFKIFSFYNIASRSSMVIGNEGIYNDFSKIKEKKMIIKNYELYFIEKHNKPFIRKCEEKYIYSKLYLLTLKQINMIFSYLNRIEYKEYIKNLNNLSDKDSYINLSELGNNEEYDINYSSIICLGSYMNRNIYGFSRIENPEEIYNNYSIGVDNYPNTKKIAKLIKLLMINFPENTKEHFINYIFNDSHNNGLNKKMLTDKKNEINHLLISKKKTLYSVNSKNNSGIQSILSGIQPEFSFSPNFNSNTYNNILNTNTNNNINNINSFNNKNLGTISYNASCFDFTSDYINSLRNKDETISKEVLDLMKSISQQKRINKTINNNYNTYNNYNSNNNNNNNNINNKDINISNFFFENDSKKSPQYIKIDISKINEDTNNDINENNNPKNEILNNSINNNNNNNNINNKLPIKKLMQAQLKKNNLVSHFNSKKFTKSNSNNISDNTQSILEDNKENYNSFSNCGYINKSQKIKKISDFTLIKVKNLLNKNKSKIFDKKTYISNNTSGVNKTFLKGEDIFMATNTWNIKSKSGIYRNRQNQIRYSDYKLFRENPIFKMSNKLKTSNQMKKIKIVKMK